MSYNFSLLLESLCQAQDCEISMKHKLAYDLMISVYSACLRINTLLCVLTFATIAPLSFLKSYGGLICHLQWLNIPAPMACIINLEMNAVSEE